MNDRSQAGETREPVLTDLVADRRTFLLETSLLAGGFAAFMTRCKRADTTRDAGMSADQANALLPARNEVWTEGTTVLRPMEKQTLASVVARILPTDDDPGASDAHVIDYLDRELARPEFSAVKKAVLAGVTAANNIARRNAQKPFVDLLPNEQDEVMHEIERNPERGAEFIFVMTVLTLEGFLGDPRWGANRGQAGWTFIGYGPGMHHQPGAGGPTRTRTTSTTSGNDHGGHHH